MSVYLSFNYPYRFSEKIMSLHGILQELLQRREQLEANLQLQYGRYDRSSRLPFLKRPLQMLPR